MKKMVNFADWSGNVFTVERITNKYGSRERSSNFVDIYIKTLFTEL